MKTHVVHFVFKSFSFIIDYFISYEKKKPSKTIIFMYPNKSPFLNYNLFHAENASKRDRRHSVPNTR